MTSVPISHAAADGARAPVERQHRLRTIGRRLLLGLLTLFLVSVVVFAATQLLPGDAARAVLGRDATPERLAAFRREFHLNESVVPQYWSWLSNLLGATRARPSRTGFPSGLASSRGS